MKLLAVSICFLALLTMQNAYANNRNSSHCNEQRINCMRECKVTEDCVTKCNNSFRACQRDQNLRQVQHLQNQLLQR